MRLCWQHAVCLPLRAGGEDVTQGGVDALWEVLCQPPRAPGKCPTAVVVCAAVGALVWRLQAPLWMPLSGTLFLGEQRPRLATARMGGEVWLRVFDRILARTGSAGTGQMDPMDKASPRGFLCSHVLVSSFAR